MQAAEGENGTPRAEEGEPRVRIFFRLFYSCCEFVYGFYNCLLAGPSNVFKIVKMIMERNFQPVIIFSFSKKECEAYALQVSKLDFNTGTHIVHVCMRAHTQP